MADPAPPTFLLCFRSRHYDFGIHMPPIPTTVERPILILEGNPEFTMWAWRSVVVVVWHGPLSISGVGQLHRGMSVARGSAPTISVVHLLNERTNLPSSEVRAALERLTVEHAGALVCTAVLDQRGGFMAGAVKAILTGISLFVGNRLKNGLFSDVDELAMWVVSMHRERGDTSLNAAELRGALAMVTDARP